MQKIKLHLLKSLYTLCFCLATTVGFSQTINSISINPTNPTDCGTFNIIADGTLWAINIQFLAMTYSISGNVITVSLNFDDPFITLPAIGAYTHSVALSNIPAGTYSVLVNSYQGASFINSMTTNVTVTACCTANADILTSDNFICLGDSAELIATNVVGNSLQWSVNGANVSTANKVMLGFNNIGTYNVVLTATHNGCSKSDAVTIKVDSISDFSIGADTSFCEGNSLPLDATTSTGISFLWLETGQTSGVIYADTSGTYTVKVIKNACISYDTINVLVLPKPTVDLGDDILLCFGETILIQDMQSGLSYQWSTGDTLSSIVVGATNTLTLTATDANGCQDSDVIQVTVKPEILIGLSDTATIANPGSTLTINAGTWTSYLWSTGATTPTIDVSMSGIYSVTVTDADGCEGSDTISVTVVSSKEVENALAVKLFPNPATDYLQLDATNMDWNKATMVILNNLGQVVKTMVNNNSISNINISDLPNGVYYLKILDKNSQTIGIATFIKM